MKQTLIAVLGCEHSLYVDQKSLSMLGDESEAGSAGAFVPALLSVPNAVFLFRKKKNEINYKDSYVPVLLWALQRMALLRHLFLSPP